MSETLLERPSIRRRSRGDEASFGDGSSAEYAASSIDQALRAPIILTSNPWRTWVAWLSSAFVAATLCIVIIVLWPNIWYLAITLAVFAVTLAFHAKREKYTFDITSGRCTLDTLSVLGRSIQQYWFHEIKEVRLEESTDTQGGTEVDLYLVLRSGRKVPMLAGHLIGLEAAVKRQAWSEISEYLHVSKSQNSLEFLEETSSTIQSPIIPRENEIEMTRLS